MQRIMRSLYRNGEMVEDELLTRHEASIKEKIKNDEMTLPEYYKGTCATWTKLELD